eukprot:TRINITY_DN13757_c0_g1_i1.p2 TRINITY_DN13757_c0_g1~~TRINITY_DN13757_c0_g1_i1.p2  ORF type:complete len:307 (+),score=92.17 TRINITY_DN13757_c0_g1_i1:1200-2120(+)
MMAKVGESHSTPKPRSQLEKLKEAYEKERQMREELESFITENNVEELKTELEELKRKNANLSTKMKEMETSGVKANKRHVTFKQKIENDDELNEEQRERMEHNLIYKDDTIFENMSIFKDLQESGQPFEKYFREPVDINAGYLGDKRFEDDPDEYIPKGKFALLNNSLTLQHENTKKRPAPIRVINIEESEIKDEGNSNTEESFKNDLENLASLQQSSMVDSPANLVSVEDMYKQILSELQAIRKAIPQINSSPIAYTGKDQDRYLFNELKSELHKINSGKSPNTKKALNIIDQMQCIFDHVIPFT